MEQKKNNIKKLKWKQLTEKDRYKIEGYFNAGFSCQRIAELVGKSKRTIERERKKGSVEQIKTNPSFKKYEGMYISTIEYKADFAQNKTNERASNKGKNIKIGNDHELANYIERKIKDEKWSPDAINGHIKNEGLQFKTTLCTKTIYNYIDNGIFLEITNKNLWEKSKQKKRRYKKFQRVALNNTQGTSIDERPLAVEERKEIGHWEIDLVVGQKGCKTAILTLVERKSRKSIYIQIKNKTQKEVIKAVRQATKKVIGDFGEVFKSITADNGSEFLDAVGIKKAAKCDEIYYAHPYSSWERGSNENGNRILRRFIPKGTDIGKISKKELQRIEDWVNNYPRKILNYKNANGVFRESCLQVAS